MSIYGLVADPVSVTRHVHDVAAALPDEVQRFLVFQLSSIAKADSGGVSLTLVIATVVALWSASGGIAALIAGIRIARDEEVVMGFVRKRALALALTFAAIVFLGLVIFLTTVLPPLLAQTHLGTGSRIAFEILRWPMLAVLMAIGIGSLYRLAVPEGTVARFRFHHAGHTGRGGGLADRVGVVRGVHRELRALQQDVRSARVDRGRPPLALAQLAAHPVRSRGRRSDAEGRRMKRNPRPTPMQRYTWQAVGGTFGNCRNARGSTRRGCALAKRPARRPTDASGRARRELAGRAGLGHVSGGGRSRGAGHCRANRGDRVEGGDGRRAAHRE